MNQMLRLRSPQTHWPITRATDPTRQHRWLLGKRPRLSYYNHDYT